MDPKEYIAEIIREILLIVGDRVAIDALSGGVDSSVVSLLGHRSLGERWGGDSGLIP